MVKKYLFKKTILSSMMAAMLLVPVGCSKKNDLKSAANNYSYETNLSMTQAATEASFENCDVGGEEYYTEDMPEEEFYDEAESNGMSDTSRAAEITVIQPQRSRLLTRRNLYTVAVSDSILLTISHLSRILKS